MPLFEHDLNKKEKFINYIIGGLLNRYKFKMGEWKYQLEVRKQGTTTQPEMESSQNLKFQNVKHWTKAK